MKITVQNLYRAHYDLMTEDGRDVLEPSCETADITAADFAEAVEAANIIAPTVRPRSAVHRRLKVASVSRVNDTGVYIVTADPPPDSPGV